MRTLALALFLSLLLSLAAQAQPVIYQLTGYTLTTVDGSEGFVTMTSICRADLGPGARMCTSEEILTSDNLNLNAIPADGAWLRPTYATGFTDVSGAFSTVGSSDLQCVVWSSSERFNNGLALLPDGRHGAVSCDVARPIACCKPEPIPEPTSSLSLPVGAGALAGLWMIRGGA